MIPCLYDISETSYVTNGIGKMADCISCIVTEKRNGSYELKMEYPSDGIHAESITEGNIILAKPSDGAAPQPFRIYKITTPMDGTLEIAARHISYQLNFITVSPVTVVSGTDEQVVLAYQGLLDNASTECPFSFETDMTSTAYFGILEPTSFRNALGGVDGSITLSYKKTLESYSTTKEIESMISLSEEGIEMTVAETLEDYTLTSEVRSRFAMDSTSISIESGVITFASNTISIDSDNFKLTTSGEVTAKGSFTSGSDSSYKMEMTGGQITGYYKGKEVGAITMSASHAWTIDGGETETYRGVSIESEDIKLKGTLVDVNADYFNINYASSSYYYGASGTITFIYDWDWANHTLVGNLNIDLDGGSASWTNYTFSTISKVYYKTIRFHKGLMVTGLS